jgi:hypothetical protein
MAAPRFGYRLSPHLYSSLMRPYTPPKPAKASAASCGCLPRYCGRPYPYPGVCPGISEPPAAAERPGGVSMRLDISVWRSRWFWRMVVSFVAPRLRRCEMCHSHNSNGAFVVQSEIEVGPTLMAARCLLLSHRRSASVERVRERDAGRSAAGAPAQLWAPAEAAVFRVQSGGPSSSRLKTTITPAATP